VHGFCARRSRVLHGDACGGCRAHLSGPADALFAPAKTPAEIVRKLNAETVRVLAEPDLVQLFTTQGTEPRGGTPEELAGMMRAETERYRQVIRAAGIKVE
jgi:tripartite-type tricarboxylate transporter receptor subunit TctC